MKTVQVILKELLRIDSRVSVSNLPILATIADLIPAEAEHHRFAKPNGLELGNLVYRFPGQDRTLEPLVIIGHTDTVLPAQSWQRDPFVPIEEDGRLYGLGASDMKAGIAAMAALGVLAAQTQPLRDLWLMFDADEEGDALGGLHLLERYSFNKTWVVIPEASDNRLSLGQKACLDFRVTTTGIAGHASRAIVNPDRNANYKLMNVFQALVKDERERLAKIHDPVFGPATQNIGVIRGGTGMNSVADQAVLEGTRRLVPSQSFKHEEEILTKLIQAADRTAQLEIFFRGPAFTIDRNCPLVKTLAQTIRRFQTIRRLYNVKQSWTEAGLFQDWGDVVIFGPGVVNVEHQADEYTDLRNLDKYVAILSAILFPAA